MIINSSRNTNFNSRNSVVRNADRICRFVNSEFTSLSSSKIPARCNFNKDFYHVFKRVHDKILKLVRNPIECISDNIEEFSMLSKNVKKYHVANCAELTRITKIILAINGIKSTLIEPLLVDKNGVIKKNIDHTMLAIVLNKNKGIMGLFSKHNNILIVDPWLGITDFAPKVEEKYTKDFKKFFHLPNENIDDLKFSIYTNSFATDDLTNKDIKKLQAKFPQYQILNKNK